MSSIRLRNGPAGELLCSTERRGFVEVELRPCFPLLQPDRFFALIDGNGEEAAFVESPMNLDLESRKALDSALKAAVFLIEITAVRRLKPEGELFVWEIETEGGSRKIQTSAGTWPRPLGGGGYLVEDVSGDLYRIGAWSDLDGTSRRALAPLIG